MGKYTPLAITYAQSGMVKDRDAFVLSDDAYQNLENIYQWRGRLRRRQGYDLLGRLRRNLTAQTQTVANGTVNYNIADILSSFKASEPKASLAKGSLTLTIDKLGNNVVFGENGTGLITRSSGIAYDVLAAQAITGISQAASAVIIITGHTFIIGSKFLVQSVIGMVEINDTVVTVTAINAGVDVTVSLDTTTFTTYSSGGTANGSFVNYNSGEINLTFDSLGIPPNLDTVEADFGYYPSLPAMGIPNRELNDINAEQTVVFDTKYSYYFSNTLGYFDELPATTATTWSSTVTGADRNFFWGANYWRTSDQNQYYWATNFNLGSTRDPIRIYDGTDWHDFQPYLDAAGTSKLEQCRMIIPYKGRLVVLNTWEGNTLALAVQYPQRARWSQNGAPFSSVPSGTIPVATEEWRSDVKGRGGYVDAPTNQHIVSAKFVRDLLIVGFESSTYALRYTGNEILPFVWDRINTELGAESTFATVGFDKGVMSIGDKSINFCDGNNVERADESIPDEVFKLNNSFDPSSDINDGPKRVHGIRDFFERIVYWTFPSADNNAKFPDRLLVFNYHNETWSIFTDSFTCFGQFQRFNDTTWASIKGTWQANNDPWVTAKLQSQFPDIVAGNQQGFVLQLNKEVDNESSLQISAITGGSNAVSLTVQDHNLQARELIKVVDIIGTGALEMNNRIFIVSDVPDANSIVLYEKPRFLIEGITQASQGVVDTGVPIGHNFSNGQHFYIDNIASGSMTGLNGLNGKIVSVDGSLITIDIDTTSFDPYIVGSGGYIQNLDADTVPVIVQNRTYLGGGTIERVMGFEARSKKFNMINQGRKNFLGYIDFLADTTSDGEVSCEVYTDYNDTQPVNEDGDEFFNRVFSTKPSPFSSQDKLKEWQRFYCTVDAQFFEYNLTLNERQLFTPNIVNSQVLIDAIIIYSELGGRLIE